MSETENEDPAQVHGHDQSVTLFDDGEYVRWAYRLLLGREPEILAIQNNPFKNNRRALVNSILTSREFMTKHKHFLGHSLKKNPYETWSRDSIAFIHVPKTGGTTLNNLLSANFSKEHVCPERSAYLHSYTPLELADYTLYSGHFDYFSVQFIPRKRVRLISLFRDPIKRLLSWYRFKKAHPPTGVYGGDLAAKLANTLTVEEFFEHKVNLLSSEINNAYLFYFGSSLYDAGTLDILANADAAVRTKRAAPILARATQTVANLDGIGITERFEESVDTIFKTLALPIPSSINPEMVTDDLPNTDCRFSRVPPVAMTTRLSRALDRLTAYDQIIYEVVKQEFERRRSATGAATTGCPEGSTMLGEAHGQFGGGSASFT